MVSKKNNSYIDPVIEAYMDGVDLSLIRENLKLTPEERIQKAVAHYKFAMQIKGAAAFQTDFFRSEN